ncbi:hypothetical protein H0O01_00915 [Candidatus Micrarchaeota archaeon]|nr:hypothetical protein [Candidatus Micrarchaeota archaeon]
MPTEKEIKQVVDWCEARKKERKLVSMVERNELREKIPWTYRFPLIEIDRPTEAASKTSLVYDSTTKALYQYYMDEWRKIEPEFDIKIK